jgi:hypothetical protein
MKYYMKTGITEFGITGVGTRDAGTSEFLKLNTATLEFGITGGFPLNSIKNTYVTKQKEIDLFKCLFKWTSTKI